MLIIKRDDVLTGKEEAFFITINHISMGTIQNGEIKQFDLKNGEYEIQVSSSKFTSNTIKFSMSDNQIVEFQCKPRYQNTIISQLWYQFFPFNKGILLIKKQDIYL